MNAHELSVLGHMAYQVCNAPVYTVPFPHIYVPNVFPPDFYNELRDHLPPDGDYSTGASNYNGRRFADPDSDLFSPFRDPFWTQIAMYPFQKHLSKRFPDGFNTYTDLRLVRDTRNYAIGPHTDAPWKVLSSIYLPNDGDFRCPGGPHHKFENFTRIHTAPFLPNSLFAFFKTDFSFHGVEPIPVQCQRDVLLWNLYDSDARHGKAPA
jgi:hypothetical protein